MTDERAIEIIKDEINLIREAMRSAKTPVEDYDNLCERAEAYNTAVSALAERITTQRRKEAWREEMENDAMTYLSEGGRR